jgi:pyruvate kinase
VVVRRAKIVATMGPAVSSPERIDELLDAGLNVARLNMSHGSHDEHESRYRALRASAEAKDVPLAILADLQGPKVRLGTFAAGPAMLTPGDSFTITTDDCPGDGTRCSTTYDGLAADVRAGETILVDDGKVMLAVDSVVGNDIRTTVVIGGPVSDHKGLNLPGVPLSVPALSEKDIDDLRWALSVGVDLIALSFVRSAADIEQVHAIMDEAGGRLPVVAKIEKPQAVDNLAEIVAAFDAVMVARGDLGVELPLEEVPLVQKQIIDLARRNAKPVIVATQMLESMISSPRPTRAETSDVANAVLDGADAVMLSAETSVGDYPILTVQTMARIIEAVENHGIEKIAHVDWDPRTKGGAITRAATDIAEHLDAKYLVAFTLTGDTARQLVRYRSKLPMLAITPDEVSRRQMSLSWGVTSVLSPTVDTTDEMVVQVERLLLQQKLCQQGDTVVIVAGSPPGVSGSTNAVRVHQIGDAIYRRARGWAEAADAVDAKT